MQNRVNKIRALLVEKQIDALLINDTSDIYYLSGIDLSIGYILITENRALLFIDGRYLTVASEQSIFETILIKDFSADTLQKNSPLKQDAKIGFDSNFTSYQSFLNLKSAFDNLAPIVAPLEKLRCIKDDNEIALLKKACHFSSQAFDYLVNFLKDGVSESEIRSHLESFSLQHSCDGMSFSPIIAFGENSAKPHHKTGFNKLRSGDAVLLDYGLSWKKYCSDITRCVFFQEPTHSQLINIYQIVFDAHAKALEICKPFTPINTLDEVARGYIKDCEYGELFIHSLGHGVGINIHEAPSLKHSSNNQEVLLPNMVITIEPGIYIPGVGGIRLEDTILITEEGYEKLTTASLPRDPFIKTS